MLNNRSVELAKKYNVELEVISSINPVPGTVVKEETKVEGMLIKGVAKDTDVAVLTVKDVPDVPGMSFKIFSLLAQKNINVDIILQTTGRDGKKDMSFTVPLGDAESAVAALKTPRTASAAATSPLTRPARRSPSSARVCRATPAWPPRCSRHCSTRTSTSR